MTVRCAYRYNATLNILARRITFHYRKALLVAICKLCQRAKESAKYVVVVPRHVDKCHALELLKTEVDKHAKQCAANIEPLAVPSVHIQLVPASARNTVDVIRMKEVARVDEYALFGISTLFK